MPEDPTPLVLRGRAIDITIRGPLGSPEDQTETVGVLFDLNVLADLEDRFSEGYNGTLRYDKNVTRLATADELEADPEVTEIVVHAGGTKVLDDEGRALRETYYGIEAWQVSMLDRPFYTLRMTLAIALGMPDREMGQRLFEEQLEKYFTAVGTAFAIANGVDPTDALRAAVEQVQANRAELLEVPGVRSTTPTNEPELVIPGPSGSEPGDVPLDPSMSSGT